MGIAERTPEVRYARCGELYIAFQTLGQGPPDLVLIPSFVTNIEFAWEWPPLAAYWLALASFSRLIVFDKRGTGLSDRVKHMPTIEERMDDLRAVMDAAGSERAVIVGVSEGAPMAVAFAVAYPERISSLILYGPLAKATRSPDYPWAHPAEWWTEVAELYERSWGSPEYMHADVEFRAPSAAGDPAFARWWATYRRMGATPGAAAELARMNAAIDVRALLPRIAVPTLVLSRLGDRVIPVEHARYVAAHVPGSTYHELNGDDHLPWVGDTMSIVEAIADWLGASADGIDLQRLTAEHTRKDPEDPRVAAHLTARERDVLYLVERGKSNGEIATALYVSESTVRKHLQHAFEKLGVSSRTAAVARLYGRG